MSAKLFHQSLTPSKRYILMLILGIVSGSIIFIFQNDVMFPTMVLYHELNTDRLTSSNINTVNFIKYSTKKRLHSFAILFLTQITILRYQAACVYSFIYGLAGAIYEGFLVQQYGPKGIVIFILTLIPHFIFYALTWHKLCTENLFETPVSTCTIINTFKIIASSILFILAGTICESTVNLWLLKFFYCFLL